MTVSTYRGISVYDEVIETEEYRKTLKNNKHFHGIVEEIDNEGVARVRLFCGCREDISVVWLKTITRNDHHCCYHHHDADVERCRSLLAELTEACQKIMRYGK